MKMAVFYAHIREAAMQREQAISDMLKAVRTLGYTMAEVDFDNLMSEPSIPALVRDADMEISSVYCFFRFDRAEQTERIETLIRMASEAGARRIMPIPGFYEGEERAAQFEQMLSGMEEVCRLAKEAGLCVTIEDFDAADSPIRTSRGMRAFLDRLPMLQATFDTGNFRFSAENEMKAFEVLSGRIAHVHLKDRASESTYGDGALTAMDGQRLYPCPVGSGMIPMEEIAARLIASGYDGVLTAEHFGARDQWECMRRSAGWIRKQFRMDG